MNRGSQHGLNVLTVMLYVMVLVDSCQEIK